MATDIFISAIVCVGSESDTHIYEQIMASYAGFGGLELIWVSKNPQVNDWLQQHQQTLIISKSKNRAGRLNEGMQQARGKYIILNHPRSVLDKTCLKLVKELAINSTCQWGGFTHQFMGKQRLIYRFTSFYSNYCRADLFGIFYLDHCFYLSRKLFEKTGGVPEEDIFEDTLFSQRLKEQGPYKRLNGIARTSPIRFEKNGWFRQAVLNQITKIAFYCGVPLKTINRFYEKRLWLN